MFGDEFLAGQRLLVITPHADDETYGCAGSMARIKELGGEVYVVLVTAGDLAHFADGDTKLVSHQTRLSEFESVMRLLKVDDWDVLFTDAETHLALDAMPRKGGPQHVVGSSGRRQDGKHLHGKHSQAGRPDQDGSDCRWSVRPAQAVPRSISSG